MILVTGGAGFVARGLLQSISDSEERIVLLDSFGSTSRSNLDVLDLDPHRIDVLECDLATDADELGRVLDNTTDRVDVFHFAATHFIPLCDARPDLVADNNVKATMCLLDVLRSRAEQIETVVFASTAAVYAPSRVPHEETDPVDPRVTYGLSKLWGEQLLSSNVAGELAGRIGSARFFNAVGPGETNEHILPELILQLADNDVTEISVGDLSTVRDYVATSDLGAGCLAISEYLKSGGQQSTFNLGSGTGTSGFELMNAVRSACGRLDVKVTVDPARLRSVDRPRLVANTERARRELGWLPDIGLGEALASAVRTPTAPSYGRNQELLKSTR